MFLDWLFGRRDGSRKVPATIEMHQAIGADPPAVDVPIVVGIATDPGCVREVNEDSITVVQPADADDLARHGVLAVVCDGMGGHEAGEVASRLAIEAFVRTAHADGGEPPRPLVRAMTAANHAVMEASRREPRLAGMGTTCTALLIRRGLAYCAHVGDSRCYLVRQGEIFLMTEDHSAVMELVRQGAITLEEARRHPDKNVISRALGSHKDVAATTWPRPMVVRRGDRFLVCSDGLYDLVPDAEILTEVAGFPPTTACDRLVSLARDRGGHDNISVAILGIDTEDGPDRRPVRETRAVEIPQ